MWPRHGLAQKLGQELGQRSLLQRPLPGRQTQVSQRGSSANQHRLGQEGHGMTRHLILVLGDQLGWDNPALTDFDPAQDRLLMVEADSEAGEVAVEVGFLLGERALARG